MKNDDKYSGLIIITLGAFLLSAFDLLYLSSLQVPQLKGINGFYQESVLPELGNIGGMVFRLTFTIGIIWYAILDKPKKREKLKKQNYKRKGVFFLFYLAVFCLLPYPFQDRGALPLISLVPLAASVVAAIYNIAFGGMFLRELFGFDDEEAAEHDLPYLQHIEEVPEGAEYLWNIKPINPKGKGKKKAYVPVIKPQQGVLVVGGAGAGKSWTFFNPILRQSVQNGVTGFVYDFKFPTLARIVRQAELDYGNRINTTFFYVNFTDLRRTNRCNPFAPELIKNRQHLYEYTSTVIKNLNRDWIKKEDHWFKVAMSMVQSCAMFLQRNAPEFCTLPHVVSMIKSPDSEKLFAALKGDPEVAEVLKMVSDVVDNSQGGDVLASVMTTIHSAIDRLNAPETFWILSGNDFDWDLNDPENPKMVVVGNDPSIQDAVSPIISLMASVTMKRINQQGRKDSVFCLDEAPTLFIPGLDNLPATARSNKVRTVIGVQDFSQMEKMYGREIAQVLVANLGNQFIGMVNDTTTAEKVSKMFGKALIDKKSVSNSDSGESTSVSKQKEEVVPASYIMDQDLGCFVGKVTAGENRTFRGKFLVGETPEVGEEEMPYLVSSAMSNEEFEEIVELNYKQIKSEASAILEAFALEPEA